MMKSASSATQEMVVQRAATTVVALIAVVVAASAQSISAPPERIQPAEGPTQVLAAPSLKVGDTWVFSASSYRDSKTDSAEIARSVTSLRQDSSTEIEIVRNAGGAKSISREVRNSDLNLVEAGNLRFMPYLDLFKFPLTPGKREYEFKREQKDSGRVIDMKGVVEVLPMAKVRTIAGDFEAVEIIANGRFIDSVGTSSKYQTRLWYAPEVRYFIKQVYFERNISDTANFQGGEFELKSFRLAK
jgi:hypothetical protein